MRMRCAEAVRLATAHALLLLLLGVAACARMAAPATSPPVPGGVGAGPALVPRPLSVETLAGHFAVSATTPIYWRGGRHYEAIARFLSDFIGTALGAELLPVKEATGDVPNGSIFITYGAASPPLAEDGYELSVRPTGIIVRGTNSSGAFYAVQTLRQLLPATLEYEGVRPPRQGNPFPIQVPAIVIRDEPRYPWRGAMLDVSRHFLSVDEVKRFIDLIALHKLNRLHLHLSDDQGWRIVIESWPELARRGGSTEVGGGSGGYYTQGQYADIVAYASARYIVVVPEVDLPGHTNAALASYAELNCDGQAKPLYTGVDVGFSALCVEKDITYRFIDDVVREIGAMTPGPYFHIGGDEVKTLTTEQYAAFIDRVQAIVSSHGKQVVGWDEIATAAAGTSIVQHWRPKATPREAVAKGAKVIVSVANKVYLDMKYDANTPIGLQWAGLIDLETSYGWNPAEALAGVPDTAILGVEAPLWSETVATINDVEFLAFPRLAAIAEVAWTRQADRGWDNFRQRLAAQGPRWTALGLNFYRDPGVPWR